MRGAFGGVDTQRTVLTNRCWTSKDHNGLPRVLAAPSFFPWSGQAYGREVSSRADIWGKHAQSPRVHSHRDCRRFIEAKATGICAKVNRQVIDNTTR